MIEGVGMEFKTYTDGKRTIRATATMYEILYKNQGFTPIKAGGNNDKGRGNRKDKAETTVDTSRESSIGGTAELLD